MPLLNLGYALGGLTGGYNQAQTQAMQRAAYQLALQQAQSQQNAQRLAGQALAAGLLGKGGGLGGLGGGFNPQNIQPVSAPAPIPGVTTPSQAPAPPSQQQPASAPADGDATAAWGAQFGNLPSKFGVGTSSDDDPTLQWGLKFRQGSQPDTPSNGAAKPATSAPPVTTTPDTKPAPGPASDTKPSTTTPSATTAPASTTSDASGGTGGGGGYAVQIPGGPTIPLSQFFNTIDYGHLAQGIAKLAPPGTDQADIYQAVVDLSKLAEGNKTQQQQAGMILKELIGQPFKLQQIDARAAAASALETQRQAGRTELEKQREGGKSTLETQRQTGRVELEQMREQARSESQAASRALRQQGLNIQGDRERRLAVAQVENLERAAKNLDLKYQQAQLSAIRARISTFKPGPTGAFDKNQQDQLAKLNAQAAAIGEQIAAQAATAAPAQQ